MKIEEIVEKKLKGKVWSFAELTDFNKLISAITEEVYGELDAKGKLDLVWDSTFDLYDVAEGMTFGALFQKTVTDVLSENIAVIIRTQLINAKINFNEDDKNEISKRSVGGKSHKKRTTNEKTDSEE